MTERRYDVVLLGATGFTGRLTAAHLAARRAKEPGRWAIAGRRRDALEAIREELPAAPDVEVVDVDDAAGLRELAASTRVLATTVGPYGRHGEAVVAACVEAGTHYADITGEPAFVSMVRDRYDRPAREAGIRLVSCCGFDSVPHDLGVQYTVAQLPDDVPITVRGYVRARGRPSGGTVHTTLDIVASRRLPRPHERRRGEGRPTALLPPRIHRVRELGAWGVPLPTIDPVVVIRSARVADGYGSRFRYGHYARVKRLPVAIAGVAGAAVGAAAAALPGTRDVLRRVVPDQGEGPPPEVRDRSWFEVIFLGEAGRHRIRTRVAGGDPGYDETARMLGEATLALAHDDLPDATGAVTPAVGLGLPYRRRLEEIGMIFETVTAMP